jgi:hypothetical protein
MARHADKWVVRTLAIFALAQVAFQLSLVLQDRVAVVAKLTPDDLYYYLQTAWNLPRLGFPTFDGIHTTNGVQFLWFWILVGLAAVVPSKWALVQGTLLLVVALNVLAYLPIKKLGDRLGRPILTVLLGAGWLYINGRFYVSGLENSLHGLLFWCLLWQLVALSDAASDERSELRRRLSIVSVLLVLLVMVRLDSVFYVAPLWALSLFWLWRADKTAFVRSALVSAGICTAGAAMLFGGYALMAGYFLPVSGLVKEGLFPWEFVTVTELFLRSFQNTSPFFDLGKLVLPAKAYAVLLPVMVLAALALVGVLGWRTRYLADTGLSRYAPLFSVSFGAFVVHVLYLGRLGGYAIHGFWYQTTDFIVAIGVTAVLLDALCFTLLEARARERLASLAAPVLGAGLFLAWFGSSVFRFYVREKLDEYPDVYRLEVAIWMSQHLEPDVTVASWNAGQLGFWSERRVIHMEGLVNDFDYYRELRAGLQEIDYIRKHNIAYAIDYRMPGHVREAMPLVKTFVVPKGPKKGRVFEVRRNPDYKPASVVSAAPGSGQESKR